MNTFFTSDQHYYHKNICKYSNRPFSSVEEMNEKLIENYNAIVKPDDEVYHLGDFAFANDDKICYILSRLNGHKHLIYGNHDKNIMESPNKFIGENEFESISYYKEIKRGETIVLFHYGCRIWNKSHHNSILCYGHSHGSLPPFGKSVDVGVDAKFITDEYRPIALEELFSFMKNRDVEKIDHHSYR